MSIPKLCLRLAVFLCTLTIALCVTRLFLIPPRVEVRVAAPAPPPAVVATFNPAKVNFKVQQVVLDFRDRVHTKLYTQLTVEHAPLTPVPARLWVSTHLYPPTPEGIDMLQQCMMSEFATVEVQEPFAHSDHAMLNVVGNYHGCGTSQSYYALVTVSTKPPTANQSPLIDPMNIGSATPVVIEYGSEEFNF